MYRLNQKGEFNVPFGRGRTPKKLWERNLLLDASRCLQDVHLETCDFQSSMEKADSGDVVYCDPTYTVMHDKNSFIRYNESCFSWRDQVRLAEVSKECAARGVTVIVSNAHHQSIRDLYPCAEVLSVERVSRISRDRTHRRAVKEHIFILESTGKGRP